MNNGLAKHYDQLYFESIRKFKTDKYETDKLIDSTSDNRFGITLLFRPDNQVKKNIKNFIDKLKSVESNQYYYPSSDIHITVMSIIGCYSGFNLSKIDIEKYIRIIQKSISSLKRFKIEFKGLTASSSCIMIRGFPNNDTLMNIRDNLRYYFSVSDLQQSMDKRYFLISAHSTIMRFKEKLRNKGDFISLIEQYRDYDFGKTKVDSLELVFNDWYQRHRYVRKLHKFYL